MYWTVNGPINSPVTAEECSKHGRWCIGLIDDIPVVDGLGTTSE